MPDVTRIIEQTASETIYNDDWLVKDSVNQGTTKIQPSVLKAWINDGMATVEELEIVVGNIADTYNTSESYVVDDLCIHEYALYKCIGATTGTWDSTKWQATTIAEIISTIDLSAEAISYNNTSSGLEAENVQDAIGETITKLSAVGSASGAIATFDDGSDLPMPKLEVAIEPQQDLHGYDAPWVGGAGKNKLKYPYYASSTTINGVTFTVNDDGTVKVNGTATADASFYLAYTGSDMVLPQGEYTLNGCPIGGSNTTYMLNITNISTQDTGSGANFTSDGTTSLNIRIIVRANTTVSNLLFKPMIRLASVTDATFAPYSNICPISGWNEVNVTRCGKNLCKSTIHGYVSSTDNLIVIDNDTESAIFYAHEGQTYTISSSATMNKSRVALVGTDNVVNYTPILQRELLSDNVNTWTATWTGWTVWYKCSSRQTAFDNSTQVEVGDTATTYEPYNDSTYTIDLDGTRYGGTLDVVSGVLTVDRYVKTFTGTENISRQAHSNNRFYYAITDIMVEMSTSTMKGSILPPDNTIVYANDKDKIFYWYSGYGIYWRWDDYTSEASMQTKLAELYANGTPLQMLATLTTPLTIQLTPTQVKSLLGSNNVWGDTGDVLDAEYIRDMTTIINSLIARIEALENQ